LLERASVHTDKAELLDLRTEFLHHYHKRSNVESTFSMMKRKFRDGLRSKTDVAMVNVTLCKVLCHNLVVLIHEMYELGVDSYFLEI
jgi:transposase